MKNRNLKILAMLLSALIWAGCGTGDDFQADSKTTLESTVEDVAEESMAENTDEIAEDEVGESYVLTFEATTTEGKVMTSDCFGDSKLTMLNIWGTYCNPCLMEMPDLGEIAASYDVADFQLVGIICDVPQGADEADVDNAKTLIEDTGASYPHLLLSESLYTNLVGGTDAVPTSFFVNEEGEVLGYVVGANSKETWVNLIEQLLAEME